MNCKCKTNNHTANCTAKTTALSGLSFKLDGANLVPYENGVPLEPVDLTELVQVAETETRLTADIDNKALVYSSERTNSSDATPDTIPFTSILNSGKLNDLKDVNQDQPNNGALLIYDEGLKTWKPFTISDGTIVSSIGLGTNGFPVKQSVSGVGPTSPASTPIGGTILWSGPVNTLPAGFVVEDGRALNRVVYATLFNILGTTWGPGNGTTTFNIPNSQGRTSVGVSSDEPFNTLAKASGQLTNNTNHSHRMPFGWDANRYYAWNDANGGPIFGSYVETGTSQFSFGTSNLSSGPSRLGLTEVGGSSTQTNIQPSISRYYVMRIV